MPDNVSFIHPETGETKDEMDPTWIGAANSAGTPTPLDSKIPDYDPENDVAVSGPSLAPEILSDLAAGERAAGIERPKARALSKAERHAAELEADRIRTEAERERIAQGKEIEAERRRFNEIDPQRLSAFIVALCLGILIFITSAVFSFPAVAHAAENMRPVWSWLNWVVPGFVEAFVIFFGIDTVIWQARAANPRYVAEQVEAAQKGSNSALRWMLVFAGIGVLANAFSTFQSWGGTLQVFADYRADFGLLMAALAPLAVVLITKRVSRLVFIYAVRR
jgi:hypothetical protein